MVIVYYVNNFKKQPKDKNMLTKEAIKYYGTVKLLADAIGTWPHAVYKWGERPPMARQYQIEVLTKGALKADESK